MNLADAVIPAPVVADADVDAWADPPRAAAAMSAPLLVVDGFEGPLDWLLQMVRAHRIDLARLSIRALIEAFAGAMETAFRRGAGDPPVSLPQWGDWLVMATRLTELRSKLLLPAHDAAARAAQRDAGTLRRQLISHGQMRAVADWLERRPQLRREVFARGRPEQADGASGATRAGADSGDLTTLLRACLPRTDTEESDPLRQRDAVASTLITGLELARDRHLTLHQDDTWQAIRLRQHDKRDDSSADAGL